MKVAKILGVILVVIGLFVLLDVLVAGFSSELGVAPALTIADLLVGLLIILGGFYLTRKK